MRIKAGSTWRDPKQVAVKTDAVWKEASEVHHKQGNGEWLKVYDKAPVFRFIANSGGNDAVNPCIYDRFWGGNYIVQPGDYLEYEMCIGVGVQYPAIELAFTGHPASPRAAFYTLAMTGYTVPSDQNGNLAHAGTHGMWKSGVWHYRKIGLGPIVGTDVIAALAVFEDNSGGRKESYYRRVSIKSSNGTVKVNLFSNALGVPQADPWYNPGDLRDYTYVVKDVIGPYNP